VRVVGVRGTALVVEPLAQPRAIPDATAPGGGGADAA
jgi:hypothetical protein